MSPNCGTEGCLGLCHPRCALRAPDERQGVEGHEPMPKGKTAQDWSYRAHCKRDGEPWPCRTVLMHRVAALDAQAPAGLRARDKSFTQADVDAAYIKGVGDHFDHVVTAEYHALTPHLKSQPTKEEE